MNDRRHLTEAETRNQFLCSCDDCSRKAAHAWTSEMDRVYSGEQSLAQAQANFEARYPAEPGAADRCVVRDGASAVTDGACAGCGNRLAELFAALRIWCPRDGGKP